MNSVSSIALLLASDLYIHPLILGALGETVTERAGHQSGVWRHDDARRSSSLYSCFAH